MKKTVEAWAVVDKGGICFESHVPESALAIYWARAIAKECKQDGERVVRVTIEWEEE